jgi:hypothetical protein
VSGACQHAAVVTAHRTRTHYGDFHGRLSRQHDFAKWPILDQMDGPVSHLKFTNRSVTRIDMGPPGADVYRRRTYDM